MFVSEMQSFGCKSRSIALVEGSLNPNLKDKPLMLAKAATT